MRARHTMHTTSTLLRVELSAHAATLRTFAIVVAVFAAANLVMHGATPTIVVCILTVAFLPSILFAQDERAHHRKIGRASCRKECRSRWSPYH